MEPAAPVAKPAPVVKKVAPAAKPAPVVKEAAPIAKPAPVLEKTAPAKKGVRNFSAKAPDHAILVVHTPADAVIYLAGRKMTATGNVRSYRVPLNDADRQYQYPVRLQFTRDGKTLAANHTQTLVAGKTITLRVDENDLERVTAVAVR